MAMELIDGFAGQPHIDSADLAALNQGCFGSGDYVFEYGERLAAEMTTSNQVTIGTGALVSGGRRAVNLSAQSLTVTSGTQGQLRNDLVVARYARDASSSVETMDLAVLTGTPVSYGTAADPDVSEGEMPLWRIPLDGITPGTPVQLFETIPSIDSLRDSLSQRVLWEGSFSSGSITVNGVSSWLMLLVIVDGRYGVPCFVSSASIIGVSGMATSYHPNIRLVSVGLQLSGDVISYGSGSDAADARGLNGDVASVSVALPITRIVGLARL